MRPTPPRLTPTRAHISRTGVGGRRPEASKSPCPDLPPGSDLRPLLLPSATAFVIREGMSEVPDKEEFTSNEWRVIQAHRTPASVQRLLTGTRYNREREGATLRSFREVLRRGEAHCLEAALTAAVILEQHGYPPLLLSLE